MVAAAREVTRLRSWASCSSDSNSSCPGATCSIVVIQQARWVARQTRSRQWSEYASASSDWPSRTSLTSAVASAATSATARLRPLAPVGGTMWAASPARNSRRYRIGAAPKRPPVPHRRGDEGAQRGDALLQDRAGGQLPARHRHPVPELRPDPVVGPAVDVLVRGHLEVEAAELPRAPAVEG